MTGTDQQIEHVHQLIREKIEGGRGGRDDFNEGGGQNWSQQGWNQWTAATVATIPSKAATVWSVQTTKSTSAILDSGSNPSNTENNNSMEYNNLYRNR